MSLSNTQLQHVIGEDCDASSVIGIARAIRNLEPNLLEMIGHKALDGEDVVTLCDNVREALSAADVLERLHGYCGSLSQ